MADVAWVRGHAFARPNRLYAVNGRSKVRAIGAVWLVIARLGRPRAIVVALEVELL